MVWDRGSSDRLIVSRDGGRTFRVIRPNIRGDGFVERIAVDAVDGRLMLARDDLRPTLLRVARRRPPVHHEPDRPFAAFAVDPTRRGVWYAARTTRLYVTRDAGRTLAASSSAPPGGRISELGIGAGRLWAVTATRISSMPIGGAAR